MQQYQVSWSDKYDLTMKVEKLQKFAELLEDLSSHSTVSDSISFIAKEMKELSSDSAKILERVYPVRGSEDSPI